MLPSKRVPVNCYHPNCFVMHVQVARFSGQIVSISENDARGQLDLPWTRSFGRLQTGELPESRNP
jgi:hypothetical protein